MNNNIEVLLTNFLPKKMELPISLLGQIAFNTRSKNEEHMLIILNESIHEGHLYQPLQTNKKQFKIAVTFLTAYNGIFNVTTSNNRFQFKKTITNEGNFIQITNPQGGSGIQPLNIEIQRIITDKRYYTAFNDPFKIKPNFSTLGSIIEISPQGPIIGFVSDDSIGNLFRFNETILFEEHKL